MTTHIIPTAPGPALVPEDLRQEIAFELEAPHSLGTRWGTLIIGIYFLLQAPLYFAMSGGRVGGLAGWITLAAGATLLGIGLSLWCLPTVPGRSELLAALGLVAIMAQVLTNILVRGSWIHTSDLMILVVALAILVRRRTLFFGLLLTALGSWWIAALLDHQERQLHHWALGMTSAGLASVVIFFHVRRMWGTQEELMLRDRLREAEEARLVAELTEALTNVQTLRGLIPICAHCKNIRNDKGYWEQVETYIGKHSDARFTHGICPACLQGLRAEL